MAITYPLTIPSTPGFSSIEWIPESTVAGSLDPFTFQPTAYDWGGKVRSIRVELPHMSVTNAKAWQAFFHKLNGQTGTFYLSDTVGAGGQGTVAGVPAPLVNGAAQTGTTLVTNAWTAADTVKAGDWISIGARLYTIISDATADGSGNMTLTVWPDVDGVPDNAPIKYGYLAKGVFRLDEFPAFMWDETRLQAGFSFTATEELNPIVQYVFALDYITAIEAVGAVPTTEEKDAMEVFFAAVDLTLWSRMYCTVWGVAAANAVDMVDPNRNGTWSGGASHQAGYVAGNGTNSYIDMGVSASEAGMALGSAALITWASQVGIGHQIPLGASDSGTSEIILDPNYVDEYNARVVSFSTDQIVAKNQYVPVTGLFGFNRYPTATPTLDLRLRQTSGYTWLFDTQLANNGTLQTTRKIFGLAHNNAGVTEKYCSGSYALLGVGVGHTDGEVTTLDDSMFTMFAAFTTHQPLRPDARAYIEAIEAAGASPTGVEKLAINEFYCSTVTGFGVEDQARIFLTVWGNAASNAVDMVDPTRSGTWVGTMTHAAGYSASDGSTGYLDFGATPAEMGLSNSQAFLAWYAGETSNAAMTVMGASGASESTSMLEASLSSNILTGTAMQSSQTMTDTPTITAGVFSFQRRSTSRKLYTCASKTSVTTELHVATTAQGTTPTVNLYGFAKNANGTATNFCTAANKISMFMVGDAGTNLIMSEYMLPSIYRLMSGLDTHQPTI